VNTMSCLDCCVLGVLQIATHTHREGYSSGCARPLETARRMIREARLRSAEQAVEGDGAPPLWTSLRNRGVMITIHTTVMRAKTVPVFNPPISRLDSATVNGMTACM